MTLYTHEGKLLMVGGKFATNVACCCGGDCTACCQCWRITAAIGSDSGCAEITGTAEDGDCLCNLSGDIDICDATSGSTNAVVTLTFAKLTYYRIVLRLQYDDTDYGGSDDETGIYQSFTVDPDDCDDFVCAVTMPSVGTITLTFAACTGATCACGVACNTCSPKLLDEYTATIAGAGGGLSGVNGTYKLDWNSSCLWLGDSRNSLIYIFGNWNFTIQIGGASCQLEFVKSGACAPTGSYSLDHCVDISCSGACTASSGVTCVIS